MELTDKQIKQIAKFISIIDIKTYIEEHLLEYEQFLNEECQKQEQLL